MPISTMRNHVSGYTIRLQQMLFGLLMLVVGLYATRSMMRGGTGNLQMAVAVIIGASLVLLLDRHYWILCPIGFVAGNLIPSVRGFNAAEMGCMIVIATHFVRRALRQDEGLHFRYMVLFALPYFVWAAISFVMNPPGLYTMGGQTIGARFYFKLVIAFWAMIVLSMQKLSEDDCRNLFYALIITSSCVLARSIYRRSLASIDEAAVTDYALLPAAAVFYWLMSRFRLSRFLSISWRSIAAAVLLLAVLFSGKRRGAFNVALFPLIRAFVARQDRGKAVALYIIALIPLALILAGQGNLYSLPLPIQRGLSFLPAKWDSRVSHYAGGEDPFRDNVRSYAWQTVREKPMFGRKGFAIPLQEIFWVNYGVTTHDYEGHAVSGNWHNTWIGMMADFGIPAAVWWGMFCIVALYVFHTKMRYCQSEPYQSTVLIYYYSGFIMMLLASHTSGHSSLQPFQWWPIFGIALAVTVPSNLKV